MNAEPSLPPRQPITDPDRPGRAPDVGDVGALASAVEERIHHMVGSFHLDNARLYGVTVVDADAVRAHGEDGDDDSAFRLSAIAEHPDIYELLTEPTSALGRMFDAVAVVTTGWAAPLGPDGEPDGPPSLSPARRRVRLCVVVSDAGTASALRFADDADSVVIDPGQATGSLADAVARFWDGPPVADTGGRS
jgi:hypothetical protein